MGICVCSKLHKSHFVFDRFFHKMLCWTEKFLKNVVFLGKTDIIILYDQKWKEDSMINTSAFDYINVLEKAADASWLRDQCIANNIANVDTPGYKRQDVDFESVLSKELGRRRYESMDEKVGNMITSRLKVGAYTDAAGYSYRTDGNNVDIENENVLMARNQVVYQGLMKSISQEFTNLKTVIK